MKQRRLQGGSLASYIIVAVLLGVVLVGGIYGLQRYNAAQSEVAKRDETKRGTANDKPQDETPATGDDKTSEENAPSSDDTTPEEAPVNESTRNEGAEADELPATGPNDGLLTAVTLAGLTYAGVSLARSRHWTSRGN